MRESGIAPARQDRPSYQQSRPRPLTLTERPPDPKTEAMFINPVNTYLRIYSLGECSVIVTRGHGDWHLSVAHPRRYPTWDEIAEARYRVLPDNVYMALVLPPKRDYINIHPNCFQLCETTDEKLIRRKPEGVEL